jgi:4-oxalocrotonate tautomerase
MNDQARTTGGPVHIIVTAFRGRTVEQKRDLVRRLTDAAVDVLEVDAEAVSVEIDEGGPEDWGRGGVLSVDRTPSG